MVAALVLDLAGEVGGISLAKEFVASPNSASFRSIAVPYHAILAAREDVSSLPASLANGKLLAYEPSVPVAKDLLLFLPGSTQPCEVYSQLLETLAGSMHTLCLPYDNRNSVGSLCGADGKCYPELRLEAFNGSFGGVPGNNIELRLASALAHLRAEGAAWSGYLDAASGLPLWRRIRAAGHSQGAGAAAYIGYRRELPRVVQFSGVCDMSEWTRKLGSPATPASRFFGMASMYDTMLCPLLAQVTSWQAEGALPESALPLSLSLKNSLNITSLGKSHTVLSRIPPPGCDASTAMETLADMVCKFKAHDSTALNVWPSHSPYADGLWQALCVV